MPPADRPAVAITLDASQERAVELMCSARIGIITGGPGTGKTTITRAGLDRMDRTGVRYALCSPTGKAAKRLAEATGRPASTLHRLLIGLENSLRSVPDLIVVDETSMVDTPLFARLMRTLSPSRTRLIMVGDANQLPPVGPGRPFADLVAWGKVPVARLEVLHRSAQESWIHVAAQDLLRGRAPDLTTRPDFRWLEVEDVRHLMPKVEHIVTHAADPGAAQVLIPQRPGPAGIELANQRLQDALNPRRQGEPVWEMRKSDEAGARRAELRLWDTVIQTKNNYELEVFNGEMGTVVDVAASALEVDFGRTAPVTYKRNDAHSLQLAYALTIHRTQGSEFPWVVVVCHSTHSFILSRQLLYTAITRAKRGVVLVGDRKGLERAVGNRRAEQRNTTLTERLDDVLEPADEMGDGAAEGGGVVLH